MKACFRPYIDMYFNLWCSCYDGSAASQIKADSTAWHLAKDNRPPHKPNWDSINPLLASHDMPSHGHPSNRRSSQTCVYMQMPSHLQCSEFMRTPMNPKARGVCNTNTTCRLLSPFRGQEQKHASHYKKTGNHPFVVWNISFILKPTRKNNFCVFYHTLSPFGKNFWDHFFDFCQIFDLFWENKKSYAR